MDALRRGQQGDSSAAAARGQSNRRGFDVTACPKCQIHFRCALMDAKLKEEIGIEMVDLATLVAAQL
jgi:hypothetical protein